MLADLAQDGLRDRALLLRANPSFATLEDDDLLRIAEHARPKRVAAGTLLMTEGDPLRRVYLVTEGHVVVRWKGRVVAEVRGPGGVGFLSLFAGLDVAPEARAVEDCSLLELPTEVVRSNVFESFAIARNTLRLLAAAILERRGTLPREGGGTAEMGTWRDRAPTAVERLILMRRLPPFAGAHLDAVAELARRAEEVRYAAGDTLWQIGDPASFSVRIEYGNVECTNARGEAVTMGAGSVLGIMDTFAAVPRTYHTVATTPVITTRIEAATQLAVLEVHPQLTSTLRVNLARLFLEV